MDPTSALPYVNKAILFVQSKNDPITAEEYFKKAMEIDPLGDVVYGPLAQLYLTLNRVEEAISVYDKAVSEMRFD